jgi:hypothetical protein
MLRNREIAQAHIARLADPESLGPRLYSLPDVGNGSAGQLTLTAVGGRAGQQARRP